MIWLTTYTNSDSGEHYTNVWDTEAGAYSDVCAEIVIDINDLWDLTEPVFRQAAEEIEQFILQKQGGFVVDKWNEVSGMQGLGNYWHVSKEDLLTGEVIIGMIKYPDPDDDEEKTPVTGLSQAVPFQATEDGALCRVCNNYNEYAKADRDNGSYLCTQCSIFKNIFGGTP